MPRFLRATRARKNEAGHVLCDHPLMRVEGLVLCPSFVARETGFAFDIPLCATHARGMRRTNPETTSVKRWEQGDRRTLLTDP